MITFRTSNFILILLNSEKYKKIFPLQDARELILKIVFANRLLSILENFKKVVTFQTSSFILTILLNSEKYKKISPRTMVEKKLLALDSREFYNFKKYSPTK